MNKTSKDIDLSAIITQVSKDEDVNRSLPPTNPVLINGTSATTAKRIQIEIKLIFNKNFVCLARSGRKRRLMSFLLCCITASNHNRPKSAVYSPKNESLATEVSHLSNVIAKKSFTVSCLLLHYHS